MSITPRAFVLTGRRATTPGISSSILAIAVAIGDFAQRFSEPDGSPQASFDWAVEHIPEETGSSRRKINNIAVRAFLTCHNSEDTN